MENENIEYFELEKIDRIFFDELKKLGKEGWILCDKQEIMIQNLPGYRYIFYRKKIDE